MCRAIAGVTRGRDRPPPDAFLVGDRAVAEQHAVQAGDPGGEREGPPGAGHPARHGDQRDRPGTGEHHTHPNWYYNLKAHPTITVEAGAQTFTVLAQELDDTARAELWPKLVAEWPKPVAGSPDLGAAQARTTRQFPVFMLTRQD